MPEIVQEIGAYAGLAAVVGLAVLSALYFSQARDVKRLREWAGRAPERSAEGVAAPQVAQRVVAQPQPKPASAAQGATPAPPAVPGKPAPAVAAAAGATPNVSKATPVTAKPAAATPAAQKGQETPAPASAGGGKPAEAPGVPLPAAAKADEAETGAPVPAGAEAKPAEATEAKPPVPVAAGAPASAPASEGATSAGAPPAAGPSAQAGTAAPPKPGDGVAPPAKTGPPSPTPSLPSTPAGGRRPPSGPPPRVPVPGTRGPRFPARAQQPSPSETAILQPAGRPQDSWFRRLLASPRYLVLAIAGVLIIGGAAAFGLSQLGKNEAPPSKTETQSRFRDEGSGSGGKAKRSAPVNPASITVSVLNGTTIPGLARSVGDKIEGFGFQLGNVTNNADQTRNESVVLFAPGGEREAAAVGKRLGIAQREPIDPQSQALGGDARVVVIAGADKTQ